MKTIFAIIFCLTWFVNAAFSQFRLDIEITDIRSDKGKIMLQLLDSHKNVIDSLKGEIKGNKCSFSINGLAPGKYGVRYYHDENNNGKMETNFVHKPTEGYGFSNNVTGKFGPPPFEKWVFDLDADKKIMLKPTY